MTSQRGVLRWIAIALPCDLVDWADRQARRGHTGRSQVNAHNRLRLSTGRRKRKVVANWALGTKRCRFHMAAV